MHVLYDAPLPSESIEEMRRLVPGVRLSQTPLKTPKNILADCDVLYTQVADFDPADRYSLVGL